MPGKQSGMGGTCWPDRLIDDLPNIYLYASNNPSEGAIAKRRSGATLISYLTPPIAQAGLYKGLNELKSSLERWRALESGNSERVALAGVIQAQAVELDLVAAEPAWDATVMGAELDRTVMRLGEEMLELEYTLIPHGLHVAGRAPSAAQQVDMLLAMADANHGMQLERTAVEALVEGHTPERALTAAGLPRNHASLAVLRELVEPQAHLAVDTEVSAMLRALDACYTGRRYFAHTGCVADGPQHPRF
jgi:magnesium chelatase subunit H